MRRLYEFNYQLSVGVGCERFRCKSMLAHDAFQLDSKTLTLPSMLNVTPVMACVPGPLRTCFGDDATGEADEALVSPRCFSEGRAEQCR
jgi:hypothetical protein